MSDFPSLPLFTDAYIADTQHLTNEEHGAYLRLLMFAWRSAECRLPDDDVRIARMLGLGSKKWATLKPAVMAFWVLADGFWTQKRLARTHAFVTEKVEKKRAAGMEGGRPKSLENNDQSKASGFENGKQIESETKASKSKSKSQLEASASRDLRRRIVRSFEELAPSRLPPDTARAELWLAQGHNPDIVVSVIRDVLARKPDVGSLSYFDRPIQDAHARAKPAAAAHARPTPLPDPAMIRRNQISKAADHFRGRWNGFWPNTMRPDHPDCLLSEDVIAEARAVVDSEKALEGNPEAMSRYYGYALASTH